LDELENTTRRFKCPGQGRCPTHHRVLSHR